MAAPISPARPIHYERDPDQRDRAVALRSGRSRPIAEVLADYDMVVNCILQDTDDPLLFATNQELELFASGTLVVDVSCDEGMGFEWARPTSVADPMFTVGNDVRYYAVDHSPSYLWNSATWQISEALIPFLPAVMCGEQAWDVDVTIRRAIEIRAGGAEPKDPFLSIPVPHIPSPENRSPVGRRDRHLLAGSRRPVGSTLLSSPAILSGTELDDPQPASTPPPATQPPLRQQRSSSNANLPSSSRSRLRARRLDHRSLAFSRSQRAIRNTSRQTASNALTTSTAAKRTGTTRPSDHAVRAKGQSYTFGLTRRLSRDLGACTCASTDLTAASMRPGLAPYVRGASV